MKTLRAWIRWFCTSPRKTTLLEAAAPAGGPPFRSWPARQAARRAHLLALNGVAK